MADRATLLRRLIALRARAARPGSAAEGRIAAKAAQALQKALKVTERELRHFEAAGQDRLDVSDWTEPWEIILLDRLCAVTDTACSIELYDVRLRGPKAGIVVREGNVIREEIRRQLAMHREQVAARTAGASFGGGYVGLSNGVFTVSGGSTAAGSGYTYAIPRPQTVAETCGEDTDDVIAVVLTLGFSGLSARIAQRAAQERAAQAPASQERGPGDSDAKATPAPAPLPTPPPTPPPAPPTPDVAPVPDEATAQASAAFEARTRLIQRIERVGNRVQMLAQINPGLINTVQGYVPLTFWGERFCVVSAPDFVEPAGLLVML